MKNIAEILKKCPEGTKLYSPICGECELKSVEYDDFFPIKVKPINGSKNESYSFTIEGKYFLNDNGECLLFPAKEDRNWDNFYTKKVLYNLKPYDKVLVKIFKEDPWICSYFSHYTNPNNKQHITATSGFQAKEWLPFEGNEHLVGTI